MRYAALFAAFGFGAAPLSAAPLPSVATSTAVGAMEGWSADSDTAHGWRDYRGYRGYGWGHRHQHRRGGIDAGDILAGAVIIGGIYAIAKAAERAERDRRQDPYPDDRRFPDETPYEEDREASLYDSNLIDRIVDNCVVAVERRAGRDARVSAIDSVRRDGAGWNVEGDLDQRNDREFLCGTDEAGRVEYVQLGENDLTLAD